MSEAITLKHIHNDILALRKDVSNIKEQMADVDMFLSKEDKEDIKKAREEHKKGKTKLLETLEKEL